MSEYQQAPSSSRSTCKDWLIALISSISPTKGETRESLTAKLYLYLDALEQDVECMTRQSLMEAIRKFRFFPSVAELVEFLSGYREVGKSSHIDDDEGVRMRLINIAHKQLAEWEVPRLSYRGVLAWKKWAFGIAYDQARVGLIEGSYVVGRGYTLARTSPAPIVHDELWARWQELPRGAWEKS